MSSRWLAVAEVGAVGGILIAVVTPENDGREFEVHLLDTFEGFTRVGGSFIGNGAERNAIIFAENVQAALSAAWATWQVE